VHTTNIVEEALVPDFQASQKSQDSISGRRAEKALPERVSAGIIYAENSPHSVFTAQYCAIYI